MRPIERPVRTFVTSKKQLSRTMTEAVRRDRGVLVGSYRELVERVAEVAFYNPEYVLFFRGQRKEHIESGATTLYPGMFRMNTHRRIQSYPLRERYEKLARMESRLLPIFRRKFDDRVSRNQLVRWSIIQHYGLCPTPFLDMSHSLLVASSFAFENATKSAKSVFLYVLGLPQVSGSISVVAEDNLQVIRLAGVCPPVTLRPYFQAGYLAATFPLIDTIDEKTLYRRNEVDCANRLIAKFRLKNHTHFWDGFSPLQKSALYPDEENETTCRIVALKGAE